MDLQLQQTTQRLRLEMAGARQCDRFVQDLQMHSRSFVLWVNFRPRTRHQMLLTGFAGLISVVRLTVNQKYHFFAEEGIPLRCVDEMVVAQAD